MGKLMHSPMHNKSTDCNIVKNGDLFILFIFVFLLYTITAHKGRIYKRENSTLRLGNVLTII